MTSPTPRRVLISGPEAERVASGLRSAAPHALAATAVADLGALIDAAEVWAGCDVVVLQLDAARGLDTAAKRDVYLSGLVGMPPIVFLIDGMESVDYAQASWTRIDDEVRRFAATAGCPVHACVPASSATNEHIGGPSARMPWATSPPLVGALEAIASRDSRPTGWCIVLQPAPQAPGSGVVVSGEVRAGDAASVWPSGTRTTVMRMTVGGASAASAPVGTVVTLQLEPDVPVQAGDVLASSDVTPQLGRQFDAVVLWRHAEPMLRGREYLLRVGGSLVRANLSPLKYRVDVDGLHQMAAERLEAGELGVCEIELERAVVFEPARQNLNLGRFSLLDRLTQVKLGAGVFRFALHRSHTVFWQALEVDKAVRSHQKRQRPRVIWLTGLSGAGKSTIANLLEQKLVALGCHTYLLDGDNVRHGLNKDLGFTAQDRVENIRRVAEVARLMVDAGLLVIVSFISPFRVERRMARELLEPGEMVEVFVDTPLAEAERRDPKGLYQRARRGEIRNFTGIDSPYEPPETPEVRIDTTQLSASDAADRIIEFLWSTQAVPTP